MPLFLQAVWVGRNPDYTILGRCSVTPRCGAKPSRCHVHQPITLLSPSVCHPRGPGTMHTAVWQSQKATIPPQQPFVVICRHKLLLLFLGFTHHHNSEKSEN